ncbi:MAG: helix-turn-helix domain-containing protein [Prevotella sp.]|nr:helix-turn-helix domain-containing protein [Prevotella sp.]
MHMTTQQLRRKLLAVLGEAPNSYIRSLQIKRAHELLGTQTDLSISQIARLCGFYDMSHFSKIFKQCTGVSPSQYRKKE